jgi:hypothetical protein
LKVIAMPIVTACGYSGTWLYETTKIHLSQVKSKIPELVVENASGRCQYYHLQYLVQYRLLVMSVANVFGIAVR